MSVTDLLSLLRRRGWIVLLAAALTAASAFVFSRLQPTVYQSTIVVSVTPSRPDLGLAEASIRLLRNYVSYIHTRAFAQKVIDARHLDLTADDLLGNVTIDSDESRLIVQIDVRNQNGDLANDVASAWASEFVGWRQTENAKVRREDQVDAQIVDAPKYSLYSPRTSINVLAGGILGAIIGAVIVFVLEYFAAAYVRTRQDLERGLGLPLLAALPSGAERGPQAQERRRPDEARQAPTR